MTTQDDDRLVAQLLEASGKRPAVPAGIEERVRSAADQAWRQSVARRRTRRRLVIGGALAAAAVICVAALAGWYSTLSNDGESFGIAQVVAGNVRIDSEAGVFHSWLAPEQAVPLGVRLSTDGQSQVAFLRAGGASLRLDRGTQVKLVGSDALELIAGAVYIDGGVDGSAKGIDVMTPLGTVREIGTQFLVRLDGPRLEVSVREGEVVLTRSGSTTTIVDGDAILVQEDGSIEKMAVASDDLRWRWAEEVALPFAAEGRSLGDFLKWYQRETGQQVQFERAEVQTWADKALLHGDYGSLAPREALEVVLAASECSREQTESGILIQAQGVSVSAEGVD